MKQFLIIKIIVALCIINKYEMLKLFKYHNVTQSDEIEHNIKPIKSTNNRNYVISRNQTEESEESEDTDNTPQNINNNSSKVITIKETSYETKDPVAISSNSA